MRVRRRPNWFGQYETNGKKPKTGRETAANGNGEDPRDPDYKAVRRSAKEKTAVGAKRGAAPEWRGNREDSQRQSGAVTE